MIVNLPDLHPSQLEVARATGSHRFVCVSAGRRFGKSFCALVLAVDRALRGEAILWCAPITKTAGKAWTGVQEMLTGLPGIVFRHVDREVRFPGGGRILFVSADSFNRGDGGFSWLVLDEAGYIDETVWTAVLRPQLADKAGGALFISSPSGSGTWFHRMFLRGQGADPEVRSFQFGSSLNPFLPPGEIEAARNDPGTPSRVFRQEWEGSFESAEGARIDRAWIRVERPPALADLTITQGLDLALSEKSTADWSACVTVGRARNGVVWVLSADRIRASFHRLGEWIKQRAEAWHPSAIAVEQAGPSGAAIVSELQRTTSLPIRGVIPKGSKQERFAASVEARIENGAIRFAPSVPGWLISELCEFGANPAHDDGCDALVYAHGLVDSPGGAVAPSLIDRASAPTTLPPNFGEAVYFAGLALGRGVDLACVVIVARTPHPFDPRPGYDPDALAPTAFVVGTFTAPRSRAYRLARKVLEAFEVERIVCDGTDGHGMRLLEDSDDECRVLDMTPDARADLATRLHRFLTAGHLRFAPIDGTDAAALRAETEAIQRTTSTAGNVTYEGDAPRAWALCLALRACDEPAPPRGMVTRDRDGGFRIVQG